MKLTRSVQLNPFLLFLVPLAEVTFLLLLLFVAGSTFLLHPGIKVNLPFSKFTLGPEKDPIVLSITAGPYPAIYYRDQQIADSELPARLEKDNATDRTIVIRADRMAPQGAVVKLMNVCLEHGYNVVLATSPREG